MKKHLLLVQIGLLGSMLLVTAGDTIAQSNYDIYVLDVKTGFTRRVTRIADAGEYNVSWNNNGKKIVHDVVGPEASPYDQSIFITDLFTGRSTPLAGAEGGNDAAWSPDGSTIAFDSYYFDPSEIFTVPAAGGARTVARYNGHHASWNPTGRKIAFDDNNGYIGTRDLVTGVETFVTGYGDRPAWSPNGQYIAFDGFGSVGGGVWVQKVDTAGNPVGQPLQLTTSGYGPSWKNNSKELVFIDWPNGDPDVYTIPAAGGTAVRIAGRTGGFDQGDYDPAYSKNGQYFAWSSYTPPMDTSSECPVPVPGSKFFTGLTLFQNFPNPFKGRTTIAFEVAQAAHVTVSIFDITGRQIIVLCEADCPQGAYQLHWDGRDQHGQSLPGGVYLCQLKTNKGVMVKKINLL